MFSRTTYFWPSFVCPSTRWRPDHLSHQWLRRPAKVKWMKWVLSQASLPPRAFWRRSATDWADGAPCAVAGRGARARAAISSEPVTVERRSMGRSPFEMSRRRLMVIQDADSRAFGPGALITPYPFSPRLPPRPAGEKGNEEALKAFSDKLLPLLPVGGREEGRRGPG